MHFTTGESQAFERLMQEKPGHDHYDSGTSGEHEECVTCRYHRPNNAEQFCAYKERPYCPGRYTAREGGGGNI